VSAKQNDRSLPCLTGVRFLAALSVVLFHFGRLTPIPGIIFDYGRQAVSFFFILSGLVLTYGYRDVIDSGTVGWSKFFNLRLSRIVPVHLATWLIATALYVWFAWDPYHEKYSVLNWLVGLACLQVYWPAADSFGWNVQAWSISCELFFYALFPFLLPPLARHLRSTGSVLASIFGIYLLQLALYLCASWILAKLITPVHSFLGYRTFAETTISALVTFPPLRLGEFAIGMCIGLLISRPEPLLKSRLRANLLLGFCAVSLYVLMRLPFVNPLWIGLQAYVLFVPVFALTMVSLASGLPIVTPVLDSRFAILLGEASYSLYLVHMFFFPGAHTTKLKYAVCLAVSIVSSILLYWFLEQPARRIWRQLLGGRRASNAKAMEDSGAAVQNEIGAENRALRPGVR
jgi:peptidoglycan/LPS O-acetylase OafA/YrhL